MDEEILAESRLLFERGVAFQNQALFDDAALSFWRALACLDRAGDARQRRDHARWLSRMFLKAGHEDLCLLAARSVIRLDEDLQDDRALASDLIFYGTVHTRLGNPHEAVASYREVIDRCVAVGDYANAASASTNLAGMLVDDGKGAEAIAMLTRSLEYLAKSPFPDTELNTHAMLIQVVGLYGGEPALAVESAVALGKKFSDRLTPQHIEALARHVDQALEAFLKGRSQAEKETWKRQNVSWLPLPGP